MFSRMGKKCTKELTLALDSLTQIKNPKKQKPSKKPQPKPREKKSITGHKITAFLLVSHVDLLKQVFQVVLRLPVLCNTPLNVFHLVFFIVAAKPAATTFPFDADRARLPPQK